MVSDAPGETVESGVPKGREAAERTTLGKYKLERVLGTGGMGVVWAAHDPDLERSVALKVLRYENASTELRTRLLREARAMARLKHPNVLTVYEVGSEGDRDFIAMELVEGANLDAWLATKPSRGEIWQALIAAGQGLAAAHRAGLVHRDFKPHNVLRDQTGRVLVTDFGLARGHGTLQIPVPAGVPAPMGLETTLEATTPSSLDAPLTQTGALLGTPAYMAPEQYLGAPSDPRTDQFAYCVTVWQLLAGERPFRGATVDELRRAAGAGTASIAANLPRAIRRVLARGLDPEAANRWPDMHALLAALERARTRPARIARIGFAGVVAVLAIFLAIKLTSSPTASQRESAICPLTPEAEMAVAWSAAARQQGADRFGVAGATAAGELDAFAQRWIADYRSTCTGDPRSPKILAKLGCLLGERDRVGDYVALMPHVPADEIQNIDMGGVLPRTEACDGDAPVAPPSPPDDPALANRIRTLRQQLIAARFGPPLPNLARMPALVKEAEAIGWEPLLAEAHQTFAFAARRTPLSWELARDHFKIANEIAHRTRYYHLEADTWIGLLESELDAASDPTTDKNFNDLIAQARLAASNAGNDPAFAARITHVEGDFARARGNLDDAIAKYDQARATELSLHDLAAAIRFTRSLAETYVQRDQEDDLAKAWQRLVEVEQRVTSAKISDQERGRLDEMMGIVAALRNDTTALHSVVERISKPPPIAGGEAIVGRVVDADGKPVANARVVAWTGEMLGNATRVNMREGGERDATTTDADGKFTVQATPTSGIIADAGGRRSRPRLVGSGALALVIEPTRKLAGTVAADGDDPLPGVVIMAHFPLSGDTSWSVGGAIARDRTYELTNVPAGTYVLRLMSLADPNKPTRKLEFAATAAPRWPTGPTLDAIVHEDADATTIWVFRGKRTAATRADVEALVAASPDVSIHEALIVGVGDQTVEAMHLYRHGDHHARFLDNAPGDLTVCVTGSGSGSEAICKPVTVLAGQTVVPVEFP